MARCFKPLLANLPRVPGVYLIEYIPTNQMYIGCTVRTAEYGISTRVAHHFDNLTRGLHPNKTMQKTWSNDPNIENWCIEELELTKDKLRENVYMKAFGIPNGYDFNKVRGRRQ